MQNSCFSHLSLFTLQFLDGVFRLHHLRMSLFFLHFSFEASPEKFVLTFCIAYAVYTKANMQSTCLVIHYGHCGYRNIFSIVAEVKKSVCSCTFVF